MPLPPAEEAEQPKLEFSVVECLLFAFHQLVKDRHIDFLTADEHSERLKDFRQRSVGVQRSTRVQGELLFQRVLAGHEVSTQVWKSHDSSALRMQSTKIN